MYRQQCSRQVGLLEVWSGLFLGIAKTIILQARTGSLLVLQCNPALKWAARNWVQKSFSNSIMLAFGGGLCSLSTWLCEQNNVVEIQHPSATWCEILLRIVKQRRQAEVRYTNLIRFLNCTRETYQVGHNNKPVSFITSLHQKTDRFSKFFHWQTQQ